MCIERGNSRGNYADFIVLSEQQVTIATKAGRKKVIRPFRYTKLKRTRAATERHFMRKLCTL